MIELLTFDFFRNALLVSLLASIACGTLGSFIVIKRMSYLSGSMAHTAFGGIGISIMLGINPLIGATLFAVGGALVMGHIKYHFKQYEDTLIGALWATGMAVGMLALHATQGYVTDAFGYLFGNILMTTSHDIALLLALDVLIGVILALWYRHLLAITFDENYSAVLNIWTRFFYALLLVLTALTTIMLIKVVGIILVIALVTLPAATAINLSSQLKPIMAIATVTCALASTSGLILAYWLNLPSSPIVILIAGLLYGLSLLLKNRT